MKLASYKSPNRLHEIGTEKISTIVLIVSYACFVLAMWAPFGPFNGMGYETGFALQSETSSILSGFLYADELRIHTNFFYHLSYLASKAIGLPGAWLPYQIVYALLWLARGLLCFYIVQALVPKSPVFAFLVGSLAIFHASDHTLNWVGQMNQFGFIFWMLVSFLFLIYAFRDHRGVSAVIKAIVASFFCYMSLWSYEAQLPTILLTPFFVALWYRRHWGRSKLLIAIYLLPAIIFVALNVQRYIKQGGAQYQLSVLRSDFTLANIVADLIYNLKYALLFWRWGELMPYQFSQQVDVAQPLCAAVLFIIATLSFKRITGSSATFPAGRTLAVLFGAGVLLVLSSFPAYLILNSSRWLWRTQLLAGPSAALVMSSAAGLAGVVMSRVVVAGPWLRLYIMQGALFGSGAAVAYHGVRASLIFASFHYAMWERVRVPMEQLINIAPRVISGTIIVLLDVPRENGPFGHNMWFDTAVKLTYPRTDVHGYYFLSGGTAAPGNDLREQADPIDAGRLVIVRPVAGRLQVVTHMPQELETVRLNNTYDPARRIVKKPPAQEAVNRYIRFKAPWLALGRVDGLRKA